MDKSARHRCRCTGCRCHNYATGGTEECPWCHRGQHPRGAEPVLSRFEREAPDEQGFAASVMRGMSGVLL